MKKTSTFIAIFLALVALSIFIYNKNHPKKTITEITTFEECSKAGNAIVGNFPRQCKTASGVTFNENITANINYSNASSGLIVINTPTVGSVVSTNFTATGKARGNWYFEASFPIIVLDDKGATLFQGPATALSDWMTTEFVPFKIEIKLSNKYKGPATIIFKKDNPSGLSDKEASVSFPVNVVP